MQMFLKRIWDGVTDSFYMIMALIVGYIVDIALLFLLAYLLYQFRFGEQTISLFVHGIYIFGGAVTGLIVSKYKRLRNLVTGFFWLRVLVGVGVGLIYAFTLYGIAYKLTGSTLYIQNEWLPLLLLALSGGLMGTSLGYM